MWDTAQTALTVEAVPCVERFTPMYVCVCVYVCVYVCVRVRVCIYIYIFVCIYLCTYLIAHTHRARSVPCVCVYVRLSVCVCACVCVRERVCVYVRVRVWHLCMGMSCRNRECQTQLLLLLRKKTKESKLIVKSITILVNVLHRHRSNECGAQGAGRSQRKRSVFRVYTSAFTFARTTSSTRRNMSGRAGKIGLVTSEEANLPA